LVWFNYREGPRPHLPILTCAFVLYLHTHSTTHLHSFYRNSPIQITYIQSFLCSSHDMPALKFSHRAEPINAEQRMIGPIPLPWFIPMCVFAPFFLSFICWVFYQQTVTRYKNKKLLAAQQEQERLAAKEVETQMQQFIGSSVNNANMRAPPRALMHPAYR